MASVIANDLNAVPVVGNSDMTIQGTSSNLTLVAETQGESVRVEQADTDSVRTAVPPPNDLPEELNQTDELGVPISPLQQIKSYLPHFIISILSLVQTLCKRISEEADIWAAHYQRYLIVSLLIVTAAVLFLALMTTALSQLLGVIVEAILLRRSSSLSSSLLPEGSTLTTNDLLKVVKLETLKELLKSAKKSGMEEITFADLYKMSLPKTPSVVKAITSFFTTEFWLQVYGNFLAGFSSFFNTTSTLVLVISAAFQFIQPVFNLWTTLNIGALVQANEQREKDKRKREQAEKNHRERRFLSTVIVGWNLFERYYDEILGRERIRFSLMTETQFEIQEICVNAEKLCEIVLENIQSPAVDDQPDCPGYMVVLSPKDQEELIRRMTNRVSEKISSSQIPAYAMSLKEDPSVIEPALMVVVCEKAANVQNQHTRVWLIFPSELKMLLNYSLEDIQNKTDGPFHIANENWWVRLENLYKWAQVEFDPVTKERRTSNRYRSQLLKLPIRK